MYECRNNLQRVTCNLLELHEDGDSSSAIREKMSEKVGRVFLMLWLFSSVQLWSVGR